MPIPGIVVEINVEEDLPKYEHFGVLKGLQFQKDLERLALHVRRQNPNCPCPTFNGFRRGAFINKFEPLLLSTGIKGSALTFLTS